MLRQQSGPNGLIAHQPNNANYVQLVEAIHSLSRAHSDTTAHLAKMIASLANRFGEWETTWLPTVLERLPHGAPPTPMTSSDKDDRECEDSRDAHASHNRQIEDKGFLD